MLFSLLIGLAWADCPDVSTNLKRAEEDVASYFIADAEASLQEVVRGFGCARTEPSVIARYWRVKAMAWQLAEDPRSTDALAAARALAPDDYTEALGPALKNLWSETDPAPLSPSLDIKIRGLKPGDIVLVDEQPAMPPTTPPGLHLIQLIRDGEVVLGKTIDAEIGSKITLSASEVVTRSPLSSVSGGGLDYIYPMPFKLGLFGLQDATKEHRSFHLDALPAALTVQPGRDLYRRRQRNTKLQLTATSIAAMSLYGTYLSAYKLHTDSDFPASYFILSGLAVTSSLTWEGILTTKRRRQKRNLVDIATFVLQTGT